MAHDEFARYCKKAPGNDRGYCASARKIFKGSRFSSYEVDNGYLQLADSVQMVAEAKQDYLQSTFQVTELVADAVIPDHLPIKVLSSIPAVEEVENKLGNLAPVAAARWRCESSGAALDAVQVERRIDPSIGLIGGKDESDTYVGVNVAIPLALRSFPAPYSELSSQAALLNEQRYLEWCRLAENRLRTAGIVYRSLFEHWKLWRSLTDARIENREALLRRLWDAGEIFNVEHLAMIVDREDTRISGIRLSGMVWQAWIEWLTSFSGLESWRWDLSGNEDPIAME